MRATSGKCFLVVSSIGPYGYYLTIFRPTEAEASTQRRLQVAAEAVLSLLAASVFYNEFMSVAVFGSRAVAVSTCHGFSWRFA